MITKNQHHRGILKLSFNPQLLIGKIFICYHVRPLLTPNIAFKNLSFLTFKNNIIKIKTLAERLWQEVADY